MPGGTYASFQCGGPVSRSAKSFQTPIPEELAGAPPETLYVFGEHMSYRHMLGGRLQQMEGRLSAVEKGLKDIGQSMTSTSSAQATASEEILRRIGRDDDLGSYGLAGTVGGLVRAVGAPPDQDGLHGTGILGRLAKSDREASRWAALLNQVRGGLIAVAAAGAVLSFLLKDQLHHLLSTPIH